MWKQHFIMSTQSCTHYGHFYSQDNHVEETEGLPNKAKLFFSYAVNKWDAEFYAKVNDNIYVNIG